jgi:uncharacterized protein (DUF433 family)
VAAWYDRYVENVAGVQGGEPVIAGTRTPVRTIVQTFDGAYPGDLDEVGRALPHLTREQIEAGLAYYRDHKPEIDRHIERHRKALKKIQAA